MTSRTLVLKLTAGASPDPERANQALTVAATACASGVSVSLWLTGEAVWFAVPERAPLALPHATPSDELVATVLSLGSLTVCTQCAARRSLDASDLLPGVRIAGAATFVEESLAPGAQALVY
jgi:predicted peroxiredoxin